MSTILLIILIVAAVLTVPAVIGQFTKDKTDDPAEKPSAYDDHGYASELEVQKRIRENEAADFHAQRVQKAVAKREDKKLITPIKRPTPAIPTRKDETVQSPYGYTDSANSILLGMGIYAGTNDSDGDGTPDSFDPSPYGNDSSSSSSPDPSPSTSDNSYDTGSSSSSYDSGSSSYDSGSSSFDSGSSSTDSGSSF